MKPLGISTCPVSNPANKASNEVLVKDGSKQIYNGYVAYITALPEMSPIKAAYCSENALAWKLTLTGLGNDQAPFADAVNDNPSVGKEWDIAVGFEVMRGVKVMLS